MKLEKPDDRFKSLKEEKRCDQKRLPIDAVSNAAVLASIVLVGAAMILVGCREKATESQAQYALFPSQNVSQHLSQLYQELGASKQTDLCIGLVGFSSDSIASKNYPAFALRSLRRWLHAVRNSPAWGNRQVPDVIHRIQNASCDINSTNQTGKFGITFFAKQSDFVRVMCAEDSPARLKVDGRFISAPLHSIFCQRNVGYSVGTPGLPAVFISPLNGSASRDRNMEASIMHEFGHSFGLADTYNVRLTNDPNSGGVSYSGQMASSLMRYSGGVELYPDDLAGLNEVIRLARNPGSTAACDGKTLAGTANYFFCAPNASAFSKLRTEHIEAENRLGKPSRPEASQSDTTGETSGASQTVSAEQQEQAYRAYVTFTHDTYLKSTPEKQAVDLPADSKCAIAVGHSAIEVTIVPELSRLGHVAYRSTTPIDQCPQNLVSQGYLFLGHIKIAKQ